MAKRRTRKDKLAARHHYTLPQDQTPILRSSAKSISKSQKPQAIYLTTAANNRYILKDLTKTVLVTLLILFFELSIYWYWK